MLEACDHLLPAQVVGNVAQATHRIDFAALNQRRFRSIADRHEETAKPQLLRHACHGEDAVDVAHAAVETQLAQQQRVLHVAGDLARRRQNADRDRQIVGWAFFAQVGGRQVDGEAMLWIEEAAVGVVSYTRLDV